MDLITNPVTRALRVVVVDPLYWFRSRPVVFPRDIWVHSRPPWWNEAVCQPEPAYLVERSPEDQLIRWLSAFQGEILDWPPPSNEEPPLRSQEEPEEGQLTPRRRHRGRRAGRQVRERREAALLRRWRPI